MKAVLCELVSGLDDVSGLVLVESDFVEIFSYLDCASFGQELFLLEFENRVPACPGFGLRG